MTAQVSLSSSAAPRPRAAHAAAVPAGAGVLSDRERAIALAIAEAAMPGGTRLPPAGPEAIARCETFLAQMGEAFTAGVRAGLWTVETTALARRGHAFSALGPADRVDELERWITSSSKHARWLMRGLLVPIKQAHFDDRGVAGSIGVRHGRALPVQVERERWADQVIDGRRADRDLDLACEVVVVGSGAGGAAAAYELAKRGRAVLLVEAGDWHRRNEFDGRSSVASRKMYLGRGTTFAIGNAAVAVWAGRAVGGSTVINSGTCYRAPERTLSRWRDRYGLAMLAGDALAPYYDRVEAMLGVEAAPLAHVGGSARVVARGADAMGLVHGPLRRNAPGCDGQGVCAFGCPTGAKRSSDVSWVPEALKQGAQMVTGANVLRVDIEGGRARGLTARLASGRMLRVRADAVVVAGGALMTPLLLRRSGACLSSGWLGKNLSVHPATKVFALFRESIDMTTGIPQSWCIESLASEGIMFEGASVPIDVAAIGVPWVGRRFMDVMSRYDELASFGLMIQDHARGEVLPGAGGLPLIRYDMSRADLARMQRGVALLCEVFLRAGAERVFPFVPGHEEVKGEADLARLRAARLSPGDVETTAYHPLGTCRMGTDPRRSCVGPDGEAHDTAGLFVADGSAIPSSLGVNPQLTIMALALRTAEGIDARLDELARGGAAPGAHRVDRARRLAFAETMRGTVRLAGEERDRAIAFTIDAVSPPMAQFARHRESRVSGTIDVEGLATAQPVDGTLGLDFLLTRKIPYAVSFTTDDGRKLRVLGAKTIDALRLLHSMTWLPVRVEDEEGNEVGRGEMTFDLRELPQFLRSWRLARRRAAP